MNLKFALLSGLLTFGCASVFALSASAESVPIPVEEPQPLATNFKLSTQQQDVMRQVGEFAFEQIESIISSGLDPQKIDREAITKKVESLRQQAADLRPDDEQKAEMLKVLQQARRQMEKQLETSLPSR